MRRDDPPDDPFDDIFRELERMIDEMMNETTRGGPSGTTTGSNPGTHPEAHIDVHETEDAIRVVADIPGVNEEAIDLQSDGNVLRIDAAGDRREYNEHVRLPTQIDPTTAETTYNNGILEITFDRTDNATGIDIT